ncbi:MAG: DNA cytosine methyltransferase, partial [Acetobacteraceae bacterium]
MRIVDLFCGSGGMSLGMQRAGHQIICGFDFDKHALAVHAANIRSERKGILARVPLRDPHRKADLSNLLMYGPEIADLNADVIVGGPPCVAFSTANPDRGDDKPAARLTESFAACVLLSRPRYFVMENVQEAQASVFWKRSVRLLKRAGYGLTTYEMDMSWFGVGQARERVFLLGAIGEADGWATCYLDAAKDTKRTTVRDILGSRCADLY